MLSVSMTIGAKAFTRGSTEAVSHVVQPRFDAPVSVKFLMSSDHSLLANSCTASMPRTALFTIGNSSGQVASRVLRNCSKV